MQAIYEFCVIGIWTNIKLLQMLHLPVLCCMQAAQTWEPPRLQTAAVPDMIRCRRCFAYTEEGKEGDILTSRQRKFCDAYLISGNATEAAIQAGYSPKTAKSIGQRLLTFVDLRQYIDAELDKLHAAQIANAQEVLIYLTAVMRGEQTEEVPLLCGDGMQELTEKTVGARERLKAAELIGKRYGLFTDKLDTGGAIPVVIVGDDALEE